MAFTVMSGNFSAATCAAVTVTVKVHTSAVLAARGAPGRFVAVDPVLQLVMELGYDLSDEVEVTAMLRVSLAKMAVPLLIRMTV